jgi:anti-sigma factor RsiW
MYHNGEDISAYLDGELSSDAAQELEEELETDSGARAELERLRGLKRALQDAEEPDFETSRQRVWMMLESHLRLKPPLWKRRISVPYPAVAAAAVAVFALVGLLAWFVGPESAQDPSVTASVVEDADVQIAVGGIKGDELLRWLDEHDMMGEVSVKLPDTPQFRIMGEPQLMRAAELRSKTLNSQ